METRNARLRDGVADGSEVGGVVPKDGGAARPVERVGHEPELVGERTVEGDEMRRLDRRRFRGAGKDLRQRRVGVFETKTGHSIHHTGLAHVAAGLQTRLSE